MSGPPPKSPSSLVKVSRWSLLAVGVFYGYSRNKYLTAKENARKAKEEEERPAKEAAAKAEKERKYREEMEYLGRETGVLKAGSSEHLVAGRGENKGDCGCKY